MSFSANLNSCRLLILYTFNQKPKENWQLATHNRFCYWNENCDVARKEKSRKETEQMPKTADDQQNAQHFRNESRFVNKQPEGNEPKTPENLGYLILSMLVNI